MTRVLLTLGAIGAATLACVAVASGGEAAREVVLARELAAAAALDRNDPATVAGSQIRDEAKPYAARVPLPAGGTFSGIRWEELGPQVSVLEIQQLLQFNASCQWLRAREDGRAGPTTDEVLRTVPDWPVLRGTESEDVLRAAVEGRPGSPTRAGVLRDCESSHAREVAYARRLGLDVSE